MCVSECVCLSVVREWCERVCVHSSGPPDPWQSLLPHVTPSSWRWAGPGDLLLRNKIQKGVTNITPKMRSQRDDGAFLPGTACEPLALPPNGSQLPCSKAAPQTDPHGTEWQMPANRQWGSEGCQQECGCTWKQLLQPPSRLPVIAWQQPRETLWARR